MLAADHLYLMTGLTKSVANSPILVEPATMFAHFHNHDDGISPVIEKGGLKSAP